MLPRPRRQRRANIERAFGIKRAQEIRNQPIQSPITATNDIAGAGAGQVDAGRVEKRSSVSGSNQLRTSLAAGIRVRATHGFVLAIGPDPFPVFVALVGGDVNHGLDAGGLAHRFQQIDRAHDVNGVSLHRCDIGITYQRLRRQMQHNLGLCGPHGGGQRLGIAQVGNSMTS